MNKLDHVVKNNIKNKDQCNSAIYYKPKFYSKFILSSGTKEPLSERTFRILGSEKHRATIIVDLICLWGRGDTDRMIKKRHTKPYGLKIHSNKV